MRIFLSFSDDLKLVALDLPTQGPKGAYRIHNLRSLKRALFLIGIMAKSNARWVASESRYPAKEECTGTSSDSVRLEALQLRRYHNPGNVLRLNESAQLFWRNLKEQRQRGLKTCQSAKKHNPCPSMLTYANTIPCHVNAHGFQFKKRYPSEHENARHLASSKTCQKE